MKKTLFVLCIGVMALLSCSKDKGVTANSSNNNGGVNGGTVVTGSGTTLDLIRDSIYLYAKEDYYWSDALPDYVTFAPRSITGSTDLLTVQSEVNKISQYKINPTTSLPYEYVASSPGTAKYSFIDEGQVSAKLSGVTGDFGFGLIYYAVSDLRIKYVTPGSPADLAGIKRGYQVKAINGSTTISYDGANGTNVNFVTNAYSNSSTITLLMAKPDGTSQTYNLNAAVYTNTPVLYTNIYDSGNGKKTGYIVFNSFVALATTKDKLDAAFATFKSSGVTDLIVDMRYNGGGYVETAEYLDNLIAPATTSNQTMYNTYYNSLLTAGKETLLKFQVRKDAATGQTFNYSQVDYSVAKNQVKFGATHGLNLSRVFFIVTSSTASAAELTINNLRPYMNVQLVGTTTYGKPVGFFDININKYQMYIPEFETKNANDVGGYFAGMKPGSTDFPGYLVADDPTKDFGDATEKVLATTLGYIKNNVYATAGTNQVQSLGNTGAFSIEQQAAASLALDNNKFKGMLYKTLKHK